MRRKKTRNRTSENQERDCWSVLTGRGSDKMTVIEVITFSKEFFVGKMVVETRRRDFPGDDHLDGLRVSDWWTNNSAWTDYPSSLTTSTRILMCFH
jgi:hypothetical protein